MNWHTSGGLPSALSLVFPSYEITLWSWREELNLKPAVYKSESVQPEPTQQEPTEGKHDDSEKP